jgi:membrane-bound lytic murein transglycosylase A
VAQRKHLLLPVFLLLGVFLAFLAAGLGFYFYSEVWHPKPGPLAVKPVTFADLPGWSSSDPRAALSAFQRSCAALAKKPDAQPMGSYGGKVADWRGVCATATQIQPAAARAFFESAFTPVEVSAGRVQEGRFTGYYEPQIAGSHTRHGAFQTPVYGKPDDLISVDLGAFRPALAGEKIAGRVEGGKLLPYAARAEIVAKGLPQAPILFYASDPIALFFLHIQGSGRVVFEDGSQARVAYASQNGQPYTAIGKTLIARGVPKNGMSLQVIRAWLKNHPAEADAVMNSDASYVFFELQPLGDAALGANGAQGVPLTPLASLAVDPRLHGLGTPFFVAGPWPLGHLFVAQDIGGAIRGPIRGDVYFGYGAKAEANAGTMNQMGRFYALLPKAVAATKVAS